MTQRAVVCEVSDRYITVKSLRKGACGDNCAMCGSCRIETVETKVQSDIEVNIGDLVIIESNTLYVLTALFIVFVFPVFFPLISYFLASSFSPLFLYSVLAISVIFSGFLIFALSKSTWFNKKIMPKIIFVEKKK